MWAAQLLLHAKLSADTSHLTSAWSPHGEGLLTDVVSSFDQADLVSESPYIRAVYQFVDIQDRLDRRAVVYEFNEGQLVTELTDRGHATWIHQSREELLPEKTSIPPIVTMSPRVSDGSFILSSYCFLKLDIVRGFA